MKLSQIEKRIPQTLTNSKDVIQKGREYARRSSRARSTRGQENEAWALYKKNPSRVSWVDLSRDWYIALPKLATPAGNTFARGLLFTSDKRDSPKQTTCFNARVKMRKRKHVKGLHFAIFLTLGKFQFSKRKSLIDNGDSRYIALPKLATPAGNTFGRGLLFTLIETNATRPSKLHVLVHAPHVHHALFR